MKALPSHRPSVAPLRHSRAATRATGSRARTYGAGLRLIKRLRPMERLRPVERLRLMERLRPLRRLRPRVQDIDFAVNQITARRGKGSKDRATTLPETVKALPQAHLERVRELAGPRWRFANSARKWLRWRALIT